MGSLSRADFDLEALTTDQDRCYLLSVNYAYNCLPKAPKYLSPQPIVSRNPYQQLVDKEFDSIPTDTRPNSIPLYPLLAKRPWNSGLRSLRQNKHWKTMIQSNTELLHLFAEDESLHLVQNTNGKALASFARKELATGSHDRYCSYTAYMFPDADEARIALIAQTILLLFIFDGGPPAFSLPFLLPHILLFKEATALNTGADDGELTADTWEEAAGHPLKRIQDEFVARIQGSVEPAMSDTPLQKRFGEIHEGFLKGDRDMGNGGIEVINAWVDFCRHSPPHQEFRTVREYLDYRHIDIAMPYCYAAVKFSISSNVNVKSPKLLLFLHLAGDHLSIINDLASYDKEYASWENGKAKHIINLVAVMQKLFSLPSSDDAKAMSYALQLWTEQAILQELERMKLVNELTLEEWKYVEGILCMAAGNLFGTTTISRYGGEAARIVE